MEIDERAVMRTRRQLAIITGGLALAVIVVLVTMPSHGRQHRMDSATSETERVTTTTQAATTTTVDPNTARATALALKMDTPAEQAAILSVDISRPTYYIESVWPAPDVSDPEKQQLALAICTKAITVWPNQPLAVTDLKGTVAFAVTRHMEKQDGTGSWYECVTGNEERTLAGGGSVTRNGYLIAPPPSGA